MLVLALELSYLGTRRRRVPKSVSRKENLFGVYSVFGRAITSTLDLKHRTGRSLNVITGNSTGGILHPGKTADDRFTSGAKEGRNRPIIKQPARLARRWRGGCWEHIIVLVIGVTIKGVNEASSKTPSKISHRGVWGGEVSTKACRATLTSVRARTLCTREPTATGDKNCPMVRSTALYTTCCISPTETMALNVLGYQSHVLQRYHPA